MQQNLDLGTVTADDVDAPPEEALDAFLTPAMARQWLLDGAPNLELILPLCGWPYPELMRLSHEEMHRYFERSLDRYKARTAFTTEIAFAIPCAEAIAVIAQSPRIVEVGAGTGYWAALLTQTGCDVVATDANQGRTGYRQKIGYHYPVQRLKAVTAVRRHPDRDVLMSWPSYNEGWAVRAARAIAPGRSLYYIGEGSGGCTADDAFFRLMRRDFEEVAECDIPQWDGLHDGLWHYRRRVP